LLKATGLGKTFGGVTALHQVDLEIWRGEILAVIGPNGAGKTTLFNLVSGVLTPTKGEMRWASRAPFRTSSFSAT